VATVPTTSNTMATTVPTSTSSSGEGFVDDDGRNTSTRAGHASTKGVGQPTPTPTSSRLNLKRGRELASSSGSYTSDTSSSLSCAEKKRVKRTKREKIPTENHLKIRGAIDAGGKWEDDLESVHGLTDAEACVCVSIMAKHLRKDAFPPPREGNRFEELAREGWVLLKEVRRLNEKYPDCGDQTKIAGVLKML
jgi:hypothetical protein